MAAQPTGVLNTILTGAAFAPVTDRAFLRITGPDATRWLNGMVTNSIQALEPGDGNYNFVLNAQGRIQGDGTIYREPHSEEPVYLLQTDASQAETLHQVLDRFIIMDDVELTALPAREELLLVGPQALEVVKALSDRTLADNLSALGPLRLASYRPDGAQITTPAPGLMPRFYLAFAPEDLPALREAALQAGAVPASPESLDQLRLLEGRPRYGTDIRNAESARDLPQETGQTHALHFAKGCYVGQEIVERIRSRGQVHRVFTPFRLEGELPASLPAPLEANGKGGGELTSVASIPTAEGPVLLALGYARREFLDANTPLTYSGGRAHPRSAGKLT